MNADPLEKLRRRLRQQLETLSQDPSVPKELVNALKEQLEAGPPDALLRMERILQERKSKSPPPDQKV